jgi:hypothetical protein
MQGFMQRQMVPAPQRQGGMGSNVGGAGMMTTAAAGGASGFMDGVQAMKKQADEILASRQKAEQSTAHYVRTVTHAAVQAQPALLAQNADCGHPPSLWSRALLPHAPRHRETLMDPQKELWEQEKQKTSDLQLKNSTLMLKVADLERSHEIGG